MGVGRGDDQLADPSGCVERNRVRDETAEAEAEEIGFGDPQMVEQRHDVTGQCVDRHGAVGVGGVPVARSSTAITCLLAARGSSNGPKLSSIVIRPP